MVRLEVRSDKLVGLIADRIFVIKIPKLDATKFKVPMHFAPERPVWVLGPKGLTASLPTLKGANAPVTLSLSPAFAGIQLDQAGSRIEFSAEPLFAKGVEAVVPYLRERFRVPGSTIDGVLQSYLVVADPRFAKIVGRRPEGIPI
jgi:hypothetical protein